MPQSQYNYIFQFCKKGKVKQLLDSLQAIKYKNLVDERGNTLLCTALKHAQWKVLNALLKLNLSFTPNKPPLITASQCSKDDSFGIKTVFPLYPDINVQNHQQRTALMTACLLGHGKKVSTLLSLNAAVNMQDSMGNTALIEAVHSKRKEVVTMILAQKPLIDLCNNLGETALIICLKAKNPSEDIIKLLLNADADPEITDNDKKSAWLIAKQKQPKFAKIIEKHLNDKNQFELPFFTNDYQDTHNKKTQATVNAETVNKNDLFKTNDSSYKIEPTMDNQQAVNNMQEARSKEGQHDTIRKPSVAVFKQTRKTSDNNNQSEWFEAAKSGNLGKLNRLILQGIDIDCRDDKGCTALIRACGHSRRAVVSFLLQQNADIEARSNNGSTALSSSIIGNCRRVAGLLLDKKANPNGLGPANYSYATIAAASWNDAMLSILGRNGADVTICNKKQQNLFHIAAMAAEFCNNITNAKNTFQFLLDQNLDINAQDDEGNTALMILCGIQKQKYTVDDRNIATLVHFLIKIGAAPALVNNNGDSAIDMANYHKLLQTKGVIMNALAWNDA